MARQCTLEKKYHVPMASGKNCFFVVESQNVVHILVMERHKKYYGSKIKKCQVSIFLYCIFFASPPRELKSAQHNLER